MNKIKRFLFMAIAVVLSLSIFSSCSFEFFWQNQVKLPSNNDITYSLTEEDVEQIKGSYQEAKAIAKEDGNQNQLILYWNQFVMSLNWLSTQTYIALILYYYDYQNQEAKDRYAFAKTSYDELYALYNDLLKEIYNSIHKDTFFEGFTQKEIDLILNHDEEVTELNKQNTELILTYSSLSYQELIEQTPEIYRQTVVNNNLIAQKFGYQNYYEYSTENEYFRECTLEELAFLRESVAENIVPILKRLLAVEDALAENLTQTEEEKVQQILQGKYNEGKENYYLEYVNSYEGNSTAKGLSHGFNNKNVLFGKENSRQGAFNVYLWNYSTPYCYFGPGYQDLFTVAHEMGHYYSAYAKNGSSHIDIAEIHSQSNEMLLLKFLESQLLENEFKYLECMQLCGILKNIVVSTMVDEFEYAVYTSEGVAEFEEEDFSAIIDEIIVDYGGEEFIGSIVNLDDYWKRVVVENPLYYISYAISGISAVGLYVDADADEQKARDNYKLLVEDCYKYGYKEALEKSNFYSPFSSETYTVLSQLKTICNNLV